MSSLVRAAANTRAQEFETIRVAVAGSVNMDLVAQCDRLPRPGQTVHAVAYSQLPGGKGANQAVAAARLGAECAIIGRIGDDAFGERLAATLAQYGVATDGLLSTPNTSSGLAWINVDQTGENSITMVPGANSQVSPEDVRNNATLIESANVLVVQLEIPLDTVLAAIKIASAAGVMTILDPAPALTGQMPDELFRVDVMTPNQTEAEALTGVSVTDVQSAVRACKRLRDRGVPRPVITLGADGAVFLDECTEVPRHALPPRVEVVDTTAAGDAFTAALACRLAAGRTLAAAVSFGCAAGALAATALGAQNVMPEWNDVMEVEKRV